MAAILNVYYLFLDTCVRKKKTHFLRLFDWLIDWLRSTQSSHLSSRANIHTRLIGDVIPFKSLVFDTITYPCLSLCLSNCSHNYEWMRLNDEEMSLLETTLLLKTLFNYILEDKNNNNLLMKTKSMRRWDFLSQKLLLKEADNFEKPTSNNSFWLDLKKEALNMITEEWMKKTKCTY